MNTDFNFFNLIKKCSVKLDLDEPTTFADTEEVEYKKLKDCINMLNRLIILSEVDRWSFRDASGEVTLVDGQSEYDKVDGMITSIRYQYTDGNGSIVLSNPLIPEYHWNYLTNAEGKPERYNLYGSKLLIYPTPTSAEDGNKLIIKYATNNCAQSSTEILKPNLELETDFSIIPTQFSDVLIYGACLDYKGMPDKAKYQHYQQMYTNTLRQMRRQMKRSLELEAYNDYGDNGGLDNWVQNFFNSWR